MIPKREQRKKNEVRQKKENAKAEIRIEKRKRREQRIRNEEKPQIPKAGTKADHESRETQKEKKSENRCTKGTSRLFVWQDLLTLSSSGEQVLVPFGCPLAGEVLWAELRRQGSVAEGRG